MPALIVSVNGEIVSKGSYPEPSRPRRAGLAFNSKKPGLSLPSWTRVRKIGAANECTRERSSIIQPASSCLPEKGAWVRLHWPVRQPLDWPESGRRVLLVSTDPASNLDEVLQTEIGASQLPVQVPGVPNLRALNIDPEAAARAYRERVVGPYRELLPEAAVASIEGAVVGRLHGRDRGLR